MKKLYCFDFDGTVTYKDTMLEFIRYCCGTTGLLKSIVSNMPYLLMMKAGIYPNWKSKQKVLNHCFAGVALTDFNAQAVAFAHSHQHLLRREMIEIMKSALAVGDDVLVVSASAVNWVRPFFDTMHGVKVVGTELESIDGTLTGNLATTNCYGPEKVRRIMELYPDRTDVHIVAYGDSQGDKEMLDFADEAYLKSKKIEKS